MNNSKIILVTGGARYIGSHICKALALTGYTPIAYDNLDYGHEWAVKWGPLEIGDIADRMRLDEVIQKINPLLSCILPLLLMLGSQWSNQITITVTMLPVP